ncbi:hypothetical protein AB0H23_32445 [Streptomyces albogriseolus]|uniref:hypothetical protein n=1 Tax=Streptomyces albogriseolus TaxID=1887 RepID=UPI0034601B21
MAAAFSPSSSFRTAEYWAALETIADDLINHTMPHAVRLSGDARGTLQRLSSRGFGPVSLFDLCALLVLAASRAPAEHPCAGNHAPENPPPGTPTTVAPHAAPITELKRGPVTVSAHPTERHFQHLRELEEAVAEALLISPEQPRARDAARRALMARGRTVQDATAVYGIVCELFPPAAT